VKFAQFIEEMSDSISESPGGGASVSAEDLSKLDPVAVMLALGSDVRLAIVKKLADGRTMNVREATTLFKQTPESVGKHLKVLRAAGVVEWNPGADRRQSVFSIPAARRPAPGVLDYGFCVIDLNKL
jgi:hypothetical protein